MPVAEDYQLDLYKMGGMYTLQDERLTQNRKQIYPDSTRKSKSTRTRNPDIN